MTRCAIAVAIALAAAQALALDIETSDWGVVWDRPEEMPQAVSYDNTHGSDAGTIPARLNASEFYAILDGFDTRENYTSCTNHYYTNDTHIVFLTNAIHKVTNANHRIVHYKSLEDRILLLRHLSTYPVGRVSSYASLSGYWGSTKFDDIALCTPQRHDFDWTPSVFGQFYSGNSTGWFPVFYGLRFTEEFRPRPEDLEKYKFHGIAWSLINECTFYDTGFQSVNESQLEATPFTFGYMLSNLYTRTYITNFVDKTRRLDARRIATANQTLALFDKTTRMDDQIYAFTNLAHNYVSCRFSAAATYGSIQITKDEYGNYTVTPTNLTVSLSNFTNEFSIVTTNREHYSYTPWLSVSSPSYGFGMSIGVDGFSASASLQHNGEPFTSVLNQIFDETYWTDEITVNLGINPTEGGNVWVTLYYERYSAVALLTCALPESGTYMAEGSATLSFSYQAKEQSQLVQDNDFYYHENWPGNRTYLKEDGIVTTFLKSYAATESVVADGMAIDFRDSAQLINILGNGYKANSYEYDAPTFYNTYLFESLNDLRSKVNSLADANTLNPLTYTGVTSESLSALVSQCNSWRFQVNYSSGDAPSGSLSVTIKRENVGGSYVFSYKGPSSTEFTDYYAVMSTSASLVPTQSPDMTVYDWRRKPLSVRTKLRSVSEARWRFPQVRVKESD